MPNGIALCTYVLEKASLMGSLGEPPYTFFFADLVAGALIGIVVISLSGFMTPWIVYASGSKLKVFIAPKSNRILLPVSCLR